MYEKSSRGWRELQLNCPQLIINQQIPLKMLSSENRLIYVKFKETTKHRGAKKISIIFKNIMNKKDASFITRTPPAIFCLRFEDKTCVQQ